MTESTTNFEESICALKDKGFECINLGNGLVAVCENSKFSENVKVRIWDQNSSKYLSSSLIKTPAKGTLSPEDYANLILNGNDYTLEVTEANNVILTERNESLSHITPPTTSMYTSEFNGTKVSLLIVGGIVVACAVGLTVLYFTKNPPLASEIGIKSGETIGGVAGKEVLGKFLDIIGSYMVLDLMKHKGMPTGFAANFTEADSTSPFIYDPLLLDLDGDGIETTTAANGVFFDHESDGFAETSAWVSKDDGILVFDKNGNGRVDTGNEIFGNNYVKSDGTIALSGFDALSDLDSNGDGIISSLDEKIQSMVNKILLSASIFSCENNIVL